jgi:hypothetical protein
MRRLRTILIISVLTSLISCGDGNHRTPAVTRPREGGAEVDPPEGGFRAVAGQTIYVPAYSSIFTSDEPRDFNLAVTLSVRNTDPAKPIILISAKYFDHDGKLVHDHLKKPLRIGPMAAVELFVKETDTRGGISASFLVEWLAEEPVTSPVVESVMTGTASGQGVSFTSPGRVLSDRSKPTQPSGKVR